MKKLLKKDVFSFALIILLAIAFISCADNICTIKASAVSENYNMLFSQMGTTKVISNSRVPSRAIISDDDCSKDCSVTYYPMNGSIPWSVTKQQGTTYGTLPTVSKTGYTFSGWYTASTGGTKVTSTSKVPKNSSTILYAHWTAKKYTVTFNENYGSKKTSTKTVTYESSYGTLPTPTRTGYNFDGWYTSASGGTQRKATTIVYTSSNHTLYAHWSLKTYTISYNANGGSGAPASNTAKHAQAFIVSSETPKRNGYTFLGWSTAKTTDTSISCPAGGSYAVTKNTTFYAVWKANTYKINYNANGGNGAPASQTKTHGTNLKLSSTIPTRTGYTFLGWSTSKTATSATYKASGIYTNNVNTTLYAVWKINTYTVSYNANGGSGAPPSHTVKYNIPFIVSNVKPTKTGYTFKGWGLTSTTKTISSPGNTSYATTKNITFYAIWEKSTYTIKYDANGGSGAPASQTKTYGKTLTLSSTKPTRKGYTFLGWSTSKTSTSANYMPNGKYINDVSATLHAVWKANTYTVTINANGGKFDDGKSIKTIKYTYGDQIDKNFFIISPNYPVSETIWYKNISPTPPKKTDTFIGYYTKATGGDRIKNDKIIDSNITIYAQYKRFDYNFNSGKEVFEITDSCIIPFNSKISATMNLTKEDYMNLYKNRKYKYSSTNFLNDPGYIANIQTRAYSLLGIAGVANFVLPDSLGPNDTCSMKIDDGIKFLQHYLSSKGEYLEYDATNFICGNEYGYKAFRKYVNKLFDVCENATRVGEPFTFTQIDSAKSGTNVIYAGGLTSNNEFLAVKSADIGMTGTCTYKGGTYTLDLYYCIQDCYDFYYSDPKGGEDSVGIVYNDEMAFLVAFDKAAPYESCGVFHVKLTWKKGETLDDAKMTPYYYKSGELKRATK